MKLIGYQAHLNSGRVITQDTAGGSALSWDSLHWGQPSKVIKNQVTLQETEKGSLLKADLEMELLTFTETMCFTERNPIQIEIGAETDSNIIAYYYFKDWWTRPAFLTSFREIPDETSILFYKKGGEYRFLLALPGNVFRAHFEGGSRENTFRLVLSADSSGYIACDETAMLAVSDPDPYRCMEKGMQYAAELCHIPLREERNFPEYFEKIGWCSWDAFYKDVTEEGLTAKAAEIRDKKLPFGWMIIDDGWQDYSHERMISYGTNVQKFPEGLSGAVQKIRDICGIDKIGVWHAFSGYWGGIDPEGPLAKEYPELFITTHQGKMLPKPDPDAAFAFYNNWYKELKTEGISFVKVDSQSSTRQHYRTNTPTGETCAALHTGLDRAVRETLDNGLINCMGMAMENVLRRPTSGVSRNSDDFFPSEEESFKEHLLENAFNTIWHNIIYYGDWDMFWSSHPYARKHALLRALSAGPVYVSDRVGETDPEILKPLCYEDGTVLRAEKGAVPTEDCLLQDPSKTGYLKLQNRYGETGYLAVYSYTEESRDVTVGLNDLSLLVKTNHASDEKCMCEGDFNLAENADLRKHGCISNTYAVYDFFKEAGFTADSGKTWNCSLEGSGFTLYQAAPVVNGIAVFGRADKYLCSHSVTDRKETADGDPNGCTIRIRESGPVRIYAEKKPECFMNGETVPVLPLTSEGFYLIQLPVCESEAELQMRIAAVQV